MNKLVALALVIVAFGCKAPSQVPPATSHPVTLNWQAPVTADTTKWKACAGVQGSTSDALACTYAAYRCSLSAAACGDTNNAAWTEITTAATRVSGLIYVDSPGGGSYWYVVKTFQGTSSSGPSNISLASVPGTPTAPGLNSPVIADIKTLTPIPAATDENSIQIASLVLQVKVRR
jgi:hypothetical protein